MARINLLAVLACGVTLFSACETSGGKGSADTGDTGDSDTDTDTDTDSDTDSDTQAIGVYGFGDEYVPPGGDYFDTTADGIPPYSYSRHSMQLKNETDAPVIIDSMVLTPQDGVLDFEWTIIDPSITAPTPMPIEDVTIDAGSSLAFDIYFYPAESGPRVDDAVITYDGHTYEWTVTGRGRDALSLFDKGVDTLERIHGDPDADTYAGAAVGDGSGNLFYSGNVNEWSDSFSENLVLSMMNSDGTLAWSKEWAESYEQLTPDSGQNGETGGPADSLAYSGGYLYSTGRRSQSSSNSAFQTLVYKVAASTGAMEWAVGWTPNNSNPPSLAWQSSEGYAIDATLSDRVLVAGTSYGNAEVSLIALSKTDGHIIWSKQLDVASGYNDRGHALAVDSSGNAWIGGISNSKGMVARVTGANGSSPTLDFVKILDMGTGSNINSIDLDSSGNAYLSLDRRGATTYLSVARMDTDGTLAWAKTWDSANSSDQNNSHVVRVDGSNVYLGGRVAVSTTDTQFGDGFLMRLSTATGDYQWGAMYYTGKGAEEIMEHRVKGVVVNSDGDLQLLVHSWAVSYNYDHYWGYWYNLADDPLADLTLGEEPGDGAALLEDYSISPSDVSSTSDLHDTDGDYNGSNVATVFTIDTSSIWKDSPSSVAYDDSKEHEGNGVDGDNALMVLHLD